MFSGSRFCPSSELSPTTTYASEQLVVPKSIAAMLPDGILKPTSFRGTRFATSHPLDVFLVDPMVAMICSTNFVAVALLVALLYGRAYVGVFNIHRKL